MAFFYAEPQNCMNIRRVRQGRFTALPAAGSPRRIDCLTQPAPCAKAFQRLLLLSLSGCFPALLIANARAEESRPAKSAHAEDEVIELSPFTVNSEKDKGYKATTSVAGTRLSTLIKDVPMSIEVITNEFIRDTGATNLRESLRYSSGIVLSSQQDGLVDPGSLDNKSNAGPNDPRGVNRDPNDTTLKIRGFVTDQVLRDGFRRQTTSDAVNIERIEVVRGPSALLYGVGSFGGVINYLPKAPKLKPAYRWEVGVGNRDFRRSALDFTGPLGAAGNRWQAAYRLTAAVQESGDETDFYKRKSWLVSPVFSFRPFPSTYIKVDVETGESNQSGVGFQNIRSRGGSGAQQRRANFLTTVLSSGIDARTFRWSGPDTFSNALSHNYALTVEQKITDDLILRIGAQSTRSERESLNIYGATMTVGTNHFRGNRPTDAVRLALLGSTVPIPISLAGDTLEVDRDGVALSTTNAILAYQWGEYFETEDRDQLRIEVNYGFTLLGRHKLLAGYQYQYRNRETDDRTPRSTGDLRDRFNYHNPILAISG